MKYVKPELSIFQLRTGRYMNEDIPITGESEWEPDEVREQEMEVVTPSATGWTATSSTPAGSPQPPPAGPIPATTVR